MMPKTSDNLKGIPFTQYLLPNGRKIPVTIARPVEVYEKAMKIMNAGYRFEVELLTNGMVSMTISDDEADYAIEVVSNGPEVPKAVDRMINQFALTLERKIKL